MAQKTFVSKVAFSGALQSICKTSARQCHHAAKGDKHGDTMEKIRPAPAQLHSLMDIGSRAIFNEEHDAFRETARKFFQKEVAPKINEWEKNGVSDRETWLAAGEYGILGVATPAEVGGLGGSYLHAAIAMEEQSYVNSSGPAFSLHSDIVMPYIYKYGSKEQIERLIPDLVSGKKISAIAMTEPEAGSDLQGIRTFAKKDGDDYILNGSKVYITNGWNADVVIVVAVTNREAKSPAHGISLFLVEEGMPGFKKGWLMKKMGLHCSDTAGLFFEDIRLPKSALLGEENKGFYYLMNELPQERLNIGVHALAHCEWAFEETRNFVGQRKAFGKTISTLQTIQHKLAELKTEITVGRAFIDQCIGLHNNNQLDSGMASMSKYWASDLENTVAYRCVQMHGGAGYLWDTPIAKMYVDARVQPIYGGSNEIMKELIARQIVGSGKKK